MFQIVDCGNTGTMLSTREAANMATAFQNSLSKATSLTALILGNFMKTFLGFLELFQAPLGCTWPPNSGECILLVEERHCALRTASDNW